MNCENDWKYPFSLNKNCLNNFLKFYNNLQCEIILISTWANGFIGKNNPNNTKAIKELEKYIVIMSKLSDIHCREKGIQEYIVKNNIKNYIIIDDDISEYSLKNNKLCIIDAKTGFSSKDVKKCQKILNT